MTSSPRPSVIGKAAGFHGMTLSRCFWISAMRSSWSWGCVLESHLWRSHQNAHFALTDKIPCLQFIMGLLIAGARATGTTGAYYHVSPEIAGRVY